MSDEMEKESRVVKWESERGKAREVKKNENEKQLSAVILAQAPIYSWKK